MSPLQEQFNAALFEAAGAVVENWIWPNDGTGLVHIPAQDLQALTEAYYNLQDQLEMEDAA
jgi:hypothetical protein